MLAKAGVTAIATSAMLALAGCGGSDTPQLMNLRAENGPDEFAIVPPKPLELPTNLADLPAPTPGGANRTDQRPEDDAVIALGGNPNAGNPSADGALLAHSGRFGTQGGIRETLAAEDLDWRRDNKGRILERFFNISVYYKAYRDQQLDQHSELARWRKAGAKTPSAPPRNKNEK